MQPLKERPELAEVLQADNVFLAKRPTLFTSNGRHATTMRDQHP
jgi:hypothetical protein